MAKEILGLGTTANDGTGDPLKTGGVKINDNFTELYDRTDGNIPHQVVGVTVDWTNLSTTVNEVDLIWAAVNSDAFTGGQRGSSVLHNHSLLFKTTRNVYVFSTTRENYDIYETYWQLRDKLTVTGGALVTIGSGAGNTQLDDTNGNMTRYDRIVTSVIDGVAQEGGFTRDFGVTGATPIQDSVNGGAVAYTGKGLFVFKGNDGTDDYFYYYNGVDENIGTGTGITTTAAEFTLLSEATANPAPDVGKDLKGVVVSGDSTNYLGDRYEFTDPDILGLYFGTSLDKRAGITVYNDGTGVSATAGFAASGDASAFSKTIAMQYFGTNYAITKLTDKGALYSTGDIAFANVNASAYQFYISPDATLTNLVEVLEIETNGVLVAQQSTIAKINAGGEKLLTTKEYVKDAAGKIGYTVATLPSGTLGDLAYVTDATAPTYLGTLTGGGAINCPVFYNGSAWVSH